MCHITSHHMSACAIISYISPLCFSKSCSFYKQMNSIFSDCKRLQLLSTVFCGSVLLWVATFHLGIFLSRLIFLKREASVTYATLVPVVSGVVIASENRHNKSGPKEVGTGTETVTSDSHAKGPQRRKRKEMDRFSEENGSTEHRKRMREKKNNPGSREPRMVTGAGGLKLGKRERNYNHGKMTGQSKDGGKTSRSFNEGPKSSGKRRMEHNMKGRKDETIRRPASASKFTKQKKFGRK